MPANARRPRNDGPPRSPRSAVAALIAVVEALVAVAVSLGLPVLGAAVLWAAQFEFVPSLTSMWRGAVAVWLLGHGSEVTVTLDAEVAASFSAPSAPLSIPFSVGLLGVGLVTAALAWGAGRRIQSNGHGWLSVAVGVATVAVVGLLLALSATDATVRPSYTTAALLPAAIYAAGLAAGAWSMANSRRAVTGIWTLPEWLVGQGTRLAAWRAVGVATGMAVRAAVVSVCVLVGVAALAVVMAIVFGYDRIIGVYEAVGAGYLGATALTVAQFALLPTVIVWAVSWLVGPGFTVGLATFVSPFELALGPLPAVPAFALVPMLPTPGALALVVPVLAGVAGGLAVARPAWRRFGPRALLVAPGAGILAGLGVAALAALTSGVGGPGTLAHVGADVLAVGVAVGLFVTIPAAAMVLVRGPERDEGEALPSLHDARSAGEQDAGFEPGSATAAARDADLADTVPHESLDAVGEGDRGAGAEGESGQPRPSTVDAVSTSVHPVTPAATSATDPYEGLDAEAIDALEDELTRRRLDPDNA